MTNFVGTDGNDTIVATNATGYTWGDTVDGKGGNDTVTLSQGVSFISGPGNDTITGQGGGAYALWGAPAAATVNLAAGWAQDGYGGTDTLLGTINEVHMAGAGGSVTGADTAETVFYFGGNATLDMGGGSDTVKIWQVSSVGYTIRQFGDTVTLRKGSETVTLKNVETLEFSDLTLDTTYHAAPFFTEQYEVHSFTETQQAPGWWYAGVYNPPQLVPWFPQASVPVDIGADGDMDLIIPMSKGYRTGIDTRTHFEVMENVNGELVHNEALTQATPFITGARRADTIYLERYGAEALVTIAHDTAIETETRTDIPWRFGDISITLLAPFTDVTGELVPTDTLPTAQLSGRDTAVNAHAMGVGDINGDGMEDILVGDWNQPFFLLQTEQGQFDYRASQLLHSLNGWREPTLGDQATPALLIDMHLADLNGDGFADMVAGWGNATVLSRVFFNDRTGHFSVAQSQPLPMSIYGASNSQHLKTFSEDFDRDGDQDLLVLQSRNEPYYGGNYLQFLQNDGHGNFFDATTARLGDPSAAPDTWGERLEWTDNWQVMDLNGDGAMDILGHRVGGAEDGTPVAYINNGTGHFARVEVGSAGERPVSWGDFDGDGLLEFVDFHSTWVDAQGSASVNGFSVYELEFPNPALGHAYDIDGNAGLVAKILGAVFGPWAVQDERLAGIGLSYADGGMTSSQLVDLALGAALGGARTNESVVKLLYANVVGVQPTQAVTDSFVSMITSGQFTQVTLTEMAMNHEMNLANIDIVGLREDGLEYL